MSITCSNQLQSNFRGYTKINFSTKQVKRSTLLLEIYGIVLGEPGSYDVASSQLSLLVLRKNSEGYTKLIKGMEDLIFLTAYGETK